jgi:hypothetical protein
VRKHGSYECDRYDRVIRTKIALAMPEQRNGSPISYHEDFELATFLNSKDEPMTCISPSLSGLTQGQFGRRYLRERPLADIAVAMFAAR